MEYKKDFDNWNLKKKNTNDLNPVPFSEGEIWWCKIGVNIGSEQDGKGTNFERPILIIKKINNRIAWIVPLSSAFQSNKYRIQVSDTSQAVLSQFRTVDSRRFVRRIKVIDRSELERVIIKIVTLIKNETPLSG